MLSKNANQCSSSQRWGSCLIRSDFSLHRFVGIRSIIGNFFASWHSIWGSGSNIRRTPERGSTRMISQLYMTSLQLKYNCCMSGQVYVGIGVVQTVPHSCSNPPMPQLVVSWCRLLKVTKPSRMRRINFIVVDRLLYFAIRLYKIWWTWSKSQWGVRQIWWYPCSLYLSSRIPNGIIVQIISRNPIVQGLDLSSRITILVCPQEVQLHFMLPTTGSKNWNQPKSRLI